MAWRGLGLSLALILGLAPAAVAHPRLQRSVPAADTSLDAPPRELRLTFTEAVVPALSRLELRGAGGRRIALGAIEAAPGIPTTLVASIAERMEPGTYTVLWKVAGNDGHPIRGRFTFTVMAPITPPATLPAAPPSLHPGHDLPSDGAFDVGHPLFVAVRWLMFVSLLGIVGVAAFESLVLRIVERRGTEPGRELAGDARPAAAGLGLVAAGVLVVALVGRLIAQSLAMLEPEGAITPTLAATILFRSTWGFGWLLQLLGAVVAGWGFAHARRADRGGWIVALATTTLLAFTPALAGHAVAAARWAPLPVLADGLHLLGAGGWLGTLLVVLVVGLPAAARLAPERRGAAVVELVSAFSPIALLFAGVAAATGVFAAWLHVGTIAALWQSGYGRLLLLKLGVLALVGATGAYNWRIVRPSLGSEGATGRLRRSATVELVVAAAVVAITAVLVATPPPGE